MIIRKPIDPVLGKEIEAYCMAEADRYGLYLSAINMAASNHIRARTTFGVIRRELTAALPLKAGYLCQPLQTRILFDASCGGIHAALWLPTAKRLVALGIPVGFAYPRGRIPAELRCSGIESGEPGYELLPLPEIPPTAGGRVAGARSREDIPWSGTFGLSFRLLRRYSRRLVSNWSSMLTNSPIEAVVTTTPFSLWSAAMVCAARTQGIHAIYVTQGLVSNVFASPSCDSAIVWSPMGYQLLKQGGFDGPVIHVAANPTVPSLPQHRRLRQDGRRRRGLADRDFVVLVLGQNSMDQGFAVPAYLPTVGMIGAGLRSVCRKRDTLVALRPHYNDPSQETEGILRGKGLEHLAVWRRAPLQLDLACADLVVGMESTAMEEAFLARRAVVQAYAGLSKPELDFRVLGCPLARSAEELEELVENREWTATRPEPEAWPEPADIIADILERRGLPR